MNLKLFKKKSSTIGMRSYDPHDGVALLKEGQRKTLKLFRLASERVPAYKNFLKENGINPQKIITWEDFSTLPITTKDNYLRKYPLEQLCWDGNLNKPLVLTSTSGSTGTPFYFPRNEQLDWQYSLIIEKFLDNSSYKTKGPILVIVGFGMGVWIGGLITYKAFEIAAKRLGHPVSIITPGINKQEIFHALRELAPQFKETILIGYPPFIKDLIDDAKSEKIDLKNLNIRLLFAAESFTEIFRNRLARRVGLKNIFLDMLNIYGSADIGAMAYETGISILIKRLALSRKVIFKEFFESDNKIPTLAQYNPLFINFQAVGSQIVLTGDNALPLLRYSIGDSGGVFTFRELEQKLENVECPLKNLLLENNLPVNSYEELPFVYLYERADMSTKLYGAIIFVEHVKEALQSDEFEDQLTGKFTMLTKIDTKHNQFLEINVELSKNIKPNPELEKRVQDTIIENLLKKNAEYKNNHNSLGSKVEPHIIFWEHENPLYFKSGVKQKWVKKDNIK
jgi:phenylacetate-CoA ligase